MMVKTATTPTKQSILDGLDDLVEKDVDLPKRLNNSEKLVADAFVWDEIAAEAVKRSKLAWKLLEQNDLIEDADTLRDKGTGDHTAYAGQYFAVTANVKEPGSRFDKDEFIAAVSKKFKIPLGKLNPLVEAANKPNRAALSVKVVEL